MDIGSAARLADIYARSLLDLAREAGTVEAVAADLEVVARLLQEQSDLGPFLASPYFDEPTKRGVIRTALTGRLQPLTVNFLSVMIDHNRGALLGEILARFRQFHRTLQGFETVTVTVARALDGPQLDRLRQDLADALQARIDLEVRVDPSLLGGIIIRHGDRMLDNSVRGRLLRTVRQVANPENRYAKD